MDDVINHLLAKSAGRDLRKESEDEAVHNLIRLAETPDELSDAEIQEDLREKDGVETLLHYMKEEED